ncbi:PAS domain-containing protein (plasmid) [Alicyclobacillus fastidiosus]|uniref:PAS domain-containing protein n=1 Tax=Alicyclobacillus fastidiosus TaxID=392011 RepID=A0ABY6ZQV5_9BACL|nr:hypothetical protein [Alicyclobacillus fastidiosus]WAH44827.1 PAS domain-containing protein [Alicyclobacillus fastidiosus]GMA65792.1 hypothetical protein GCM10025859_62320 [Alicyclobacillus fastidiosus]GMA65864.1 hypothetical protein GCM10025859_63050 [Alicyclobacillus fastidiosus]
MVQDKRQREIHFRYINKEGNYISLRAVGSPLIGEQGDVEQLIVTATINNLQRKTVKLALVPV